VGHRGVAFVLVQAGKSLHQDLLHDIVFVITTGQVRADNAGNNRVKMPDEFLRSTFVSLLPAAQAIVDVNERIHSLLTLASAGIVQESI
jgi:hypothetical protein